ncbi:MAG: serine acetyltransferase [Sandaracinus sp.]|nr:serine acetyltransferase [Myxococcales bacterium]MCB9599239.1 serine acetyltransferase [Sandaracinus sp.]MCB9614813.1 serine acetyltransferase [Sandaracinus sp.]MCB9631512.1 serine acetyltransferase [Sandaracinus sp.]
MSEKLWSRLRKDVQRHEGWSDPAVWPLLVHRLGCAAQELPGPLRRVGSKLYGATALAVEIATGSRLHRETALGAELRLVHGRNVLVHPAAVIGDRVTLMHDVTLGTGAADEGAPVLEDDVFVGAGAKILGPVRVGRGAHIAANSLVVTDIPAEAHVMGVPARPLPKRGAR